jgi:hypothetical protein
MIDDRETRNRIRHRMDGATYEPGKNAGTENRLK